MSYAAALPKHSNDVSSSANPVTGPFQHLVTNQLSRPVLEFNPPKFAVEHPVSSDSFYESFMNGLGNIIGTFGQIPCCICLPNPFKTIRQGHIGLISRFGKYYKTTDPGLSYVNPITERIHTIDVKIRVSVIDDIPIVTKDNVNVSIDSVLYWHVIDPYSSAYGVGDVEKALVERSQTTLRSVLGGKSLQDLIENRDTISEAITHHIDEPSRQWGIKVESILIKDIQFSQALQLALSSAATQKRIGESKVIAAQAEVDSAKLMREAADILNTPAAMQIRYLETLQAMSKNSGTKVMFVPMSESAGMNSASHMGPIGTQQTSAHAIKFPDPKDHSQLNLNSSVKDTAIFETLSSME